MKRNPFCLVLMLTAFFVLHVGSVRKKDDPIRNTQTDPIALKDKMEEIKDGEKEAPLPSFKLYPKSRFLTELPMESEKKTEVNEQAFPEKEVSATDAVQGQEQEEKEAKLEEKSKDGSDQDWWEARSSEDLSGEGLGEGQFKEEGNLDEKTDASQEASGQRESKSSGAG